MTELLYTKEHVLENDIALLRPLKYEDYDLLLPFAMNEPSLWKYSLVSANSPENLKSYISLALNTKAEKTAFPFLVIDKRKNKVAGSTRFYDFKDYHKTTQLGYTWYGKEFWGTGLNKNCKYLMLEFAFNKLKLERVEFRADYNNKRSIAAMKSIGCVEEGILRSNCKGQDGRRDSIILSILREEWNSKIKEMLYKKCLLDE